MRKLAPAYTASEPSSSSIRNNYIQQTNTTLQENSCLTHALILKLNIMMSSELKVMFNTCPHSDAEYNDIIRTETKRQKTGQKCQPDYTLQDAQTGMELLS